VGSDGGAGLDEADLAEKVKMLAPRWFVMRDAARQPSTVLLQSRATMCWLRGPMVRTEIARVARRGNGQADSRTPLGGPESTPEEPNVSSAVTSAR